MKSRPPMWSTILVVVLSAGVVLAAQEDPPPAGPKPAEPSAEVATAYPGLVSGILTHARLADLPPGVLLRSGDVTIAREEIDTAIQEAPARIREQLTKNSLFLLENLATSKVLLATAREAVSKENPDAARLSDNEVVRAWFDKALAGIEVSDAEVRAFYDQNKSMFGGAALDMVRSSIRQYLLQQKRQETVSKLIQGVGRNRTIAVAAAWVKEQVPLARDNPVDKARQSGKPTMVDFGRDGCGPCDMMAPIMEMLKMKYEGKANVLFVHTGEEEILAMRYGIAAIPTQIFFDKEGREVFRHTGFFSQEEIEKKLAEVGVK